MPSARDAEIEDEEAKDGEREGWRPPKLGVGNPLMGIALQDGQIGTPGNYGGNIIKPPSWKNCSSFVGTIMQLLQSLATKTFRKVWVA